MDTKQIFAAAMGIALFALVVLITRNMQKLDNNSQASREMYKTIQQDDQQPQ